MLVGRAEWLGGEERKEESEGRDGKRGGRKKTKKKILMRQ